MASLIVPLISSFYLFSFVKTAISYRIYYSTDKKADTRIKNILKRLVCIEQMLTFVDEKKGTIKFVTIFFKLSSYPATHYTSFLYLIRIIYYQCTRVPTLYIVILTFYQHFTAPHKLSCKSKKKVLEKLFFISGELLPLLRTFIYEKYTLQKRKVYFTFLYI